MRRSYEKRDGKCRCQYHESCFQVDADLNQIVVNALLRREPSIDFQTAHAANLSGVDDPDVLALAANQGRLFATHDHRTMPTHFGNFITNNTSSGVLIVSRRLSISSVVEDLLTIWAASDSEEWMNRILSLPL